eukprot:350556-Chlamydomonas_euryale.AAC.3
MAPAAALEAEVESAWQLLSDGDVNREWQRLMRNTAGRRHEGGREGGARRRRWRQPAGNGGEAASASETSLCASGSSGLCPGRGAALCVAGEGGLKGETAHGAWARLQCRKRRGSSQLCAGAKPPTTAAIKTIPSQPALPPSLVRQRSRRMTQQLR